MAALEAYGLTGFNFCSSSQALSVSVELAVNAVAESAAEVVVLDTYTWFVEPLESTRDWVTNSALWDEPWKSSLHRLSAQTQDPYTFLLSHFYPILRSSRPLSATLPTDPTTDYQHRGFATRTFPPLDGPLDPTAFPHYLDEHHLSPAGAASYSPWLAAEIHSHLFTKTSSMSR